MPKEITSCFEKVLCIYEGEDMIAIIKQNGGKEIYEIDKMDIEVFAERVLKANPNNVK